MRHVYAPTSCVSLIFVLGLAAVASASVSAGEIEFSRDVRPILSDKCFQCHGPSEDREADLRLDTREGATDWSIVPGKPDESVFVERINATDEDDVMPPPSSHKTLTDEEKEILQQWIVEGAEYQAHWSLRPVSRNAESSIDALVEKRLREKGWTQQPVADKRTLIRRVTFDLTGLPPTLEEIHAFLKDDSDQSLRTIG